MKCEECAGTSTHSINNMSLFSNRSDEALVRSASFLFTLLPVTAQLLYIITCFIFLLMINTQQSMPLSLKTKPVSYYSVWSSTLQSSLEQISADLKTDFDYKLSTDNWKKVCNLSTHFHYISFINLSIAYQSFSSLFFFLFWQRKPL